MSSRGQPSRLSSLTDESDKQTSFGYGSPARQSTTTVSNREQERTSGAGNAESVSRRMRLLALRKPRTASALSKTRQKNLEEMKEKEKEADLMAARLDSRLEIVNLFLHKSLVDDSLLGRKELNPWLFKNNSTLRDKWNFVHNMVTTQEMLLAIENAKKRHKAELEELRKQKVSPTEAKQAKEEKPIQEEITLPVTPESEESEILHKQDDTEGAEENPPEPTERDIIIIPDVKKELQHDTPPMKPEVVAHEAPKNSPIIVSKPRYRRSPRAKRQRKISPDGPVKCHNEVGKVYAFGSTHRRTCCKYCQGGIPMNEHNHVVKTSPKSASGGLSDRLDDINGIYVNDPHRKSFNEKMQERIHQVEEIMKEKVVTFSERMMKNDYAS